MHIYWRTLPLGVVMRFVVGFVFCVLEGDLTLGLTAVVVEVGWVKQRPPEQLAGKQNK